MSKKMTSAECFDAIDVALGNFKGIADAVRNIQNKKIPELFWQAEEWESLVHQITILEASTEICGAETSDAPQVNERLDAIETNQKELEDAIKDLTKKVKDVVATLHEEMSDIAALVKIMILAIGNSLQEGGSLERKGKVKILKPRPYAGERDMQKLKIFMFDMDQYFQVAEITLEEA